MQSGTTGINTLRIYNPVKQAADHDPSGEFVRRWIPELSSAPETYPQPIVDAKEAVRQARARLAEFRRQSGVRSNIKQVAKKHGSRKGASSRPKPRATAARTLPLFDSGRLSDGE
jgi:deoxyribodipyrimidine photo-lyase